MTDKLTEDQIIEILMTYLTKTGWTIESYCFGQSKGTDIIAIKNGRKLFIEAKGAKAGENSKTKRREYFDSGQIKTHFGKAIVKLLEDKHKQSRF
jgi:Holliday junction resolvase